MHGLISGNFIRKAKLFRKSVIIIICGTLLSGCATTYQGPAPNFKLTGDEAKKEYEKFKWDESEWHQHPRFIRMGSEKTPVKRWSIDPIIDDVSPAAREKINKAKNWLLVEGILVSVSLGLLIYGLSNRDNRSDSNLYAIYGTAGASLAIGLFVIPPIMKDASEQFNRDLKGKFTPALAFRTSF
jgi:hypothetical protein